VRERDVRMGAEIRRSARCGGRPDREIRAALLRALLGARDGAQVGGQAQVDGRLTTVHDQRGVLS